MPHLSHRRLRRTLLALLAAGVSPVAFAQAWPARPVTVVVPFPAGGGTDLVIRTIQPLLQRELGQPLVIDNRGGAGGTIGSAFVAKAAPDGYTLGVATTSTHAVSTSVYKALQQVGVPLVHIPYRGAAPAYTDLIGGSVQLMFDNPVGLAPYIRSGQVKAVGSTGANALIAGIPSFAQQGLAGLDQSLWYGIVFPKGTPRPIIDKFNVALNKVLSDRTVSADLASKGVNVRPSTPQELQATVTKDIQAWGQVARAVGASLD